MSESDLNKFSVEELQAALEAKKAEEANEANKELYKDLGIDFDNPKQGDLVKWINSQLNNNPLLGLAKMMNENTELRLCASFPGKLTLFVTMKDDELKETADKSKCRHIRIWDVDIAMKQVIDRNMASYTDDCYSLILEKV